MDRSISKVLIDAIARGGAKLLNCLSVCGGEGFIESFPKHELDLVKDSSGLDALILRNPEGASAVVYLYGGQVVSWKNIHGEELLFFSTASKESFDIPKVVRGGIQMCFPQFGDLGSSEHHGLARCHYWGIDPNPPPPPDNGIKSFVDLILISSDNDTNMETWLHTFELRLRVTLGATSLMLLSRIRNTDSRPRSFTFALETYLYVSDISDVRIEGLETSEYFNNLQKKERFIEHGDAVTFDSEIDRIYLGTPTNVVVIDHEKKRTFVIRKNGLPDAILWNPWRKRCRKIADLGDEDYKRMLCIGAAVSENPIILLPGEEWQGLQEIVEVPSSYCSGQLQSCSSFDE